MPGTEVLYCEVAAGIAEPRCLLASVGALGLLLRGILLTQLTLTSHLSPENVPHRKWAVSG